MNWVVVGLGVLLIGIGFVIAVGPRNLPSSMIGAQAPFAEVDFDGRSRRNDLDSPSRRRKVVRLVIGFSLMVFGVLCIVL
jgi:hypothetical protein